MYAIRSYYVNATANLSRAKFNYVAAKSEVFADWFLIQRAVESPLD